MILIDNDSDDEIVIGINRPKIENKTKNPIIKAATIEPLFLVKRYKASLK